MYGPGVLRPKADYVDKRTIKTHPFSGYNSKLVCLVSSLSYRKNQITETYFMSPEGKLRLGCLLSMTKLDIDNPTLREWCLVVVRNLTSWSEVIRKSLAGLELIEVDPKGVETLKELGMEDTFKKEMDKLKKEHPNGLQIDTVEM
jgi:hypothetical protein